MKPSEGPIHLPRHSTAASPTSESSSIDAGETNDDLPSTTDWQMVDDNVELLDHSSIPIGERTTRGNSSGGWRSSIRDIISSFRAGITPYVTGERSVRDLLYKYRYVIGFFLISWIMGAIIWNFKKQVFEGLESLSHAVEGMGVGCVSFCVREPRRIVKNVTNVKDPILQWLRFNWLLDFPQRISSNDWLRHVSNAFRVHIWLLARISFILFWSSGWKCYMLLSQPQMVKEESGEDDGQVP